MTVAPNNLCMGCMSPKYTKGICEKCGYQDNIAYNIDYLPPQTVLRERYIVGRMTHVNGESAMYIGYDMRSDEKVYIRELMPYDMVKRNRETLDLCPLPDCEAKYKGMVAEFQDLIRTLQGFSGIKGITHVRDMVIEHSTVYAVYFNPSAIPFIEYLKRGGTVKWANCKKIILQLLNTASQIHKKGMIHAGISPSTVLADKRGMLYLSAFSTNAVRSDKSEICCELFDGYSAPEQYDTHNWYGEWTDVYALGALLYRMLTGVTPPSAPERRINDTLRPAVQLVSSIPQNVSDAIEFAMTLSNTRRCRSVDDFITRLLGNESSNTSVYNASLIEAGSKDGVEDVSSTRTTTIVLPSQLGLSQPQGPKSPVSLAEKKRLSKESQNPFITIFVPMLLTTLVLGGIVWMFMQFKYADIHRNIIESSTSGSQSSELVDTGNTVPDFVGRTIDEINTNSDYKSLYAFSVEREYSDLYPDGTVFAQVPAVNSPALANQHVTLWVSRGSKNQKMPELVGSSISDAANLLSSRGLNYRIVYVDNSGYSAGTVGRTEPVADVNVSVDDEILLYTKKLGLDLPFESSSSSSESSSEQSSSSSSKSSSRSSSSSSSGIIGKKIEREISSDPDRWKS